MKLRNAIAALVAGSLLTAGVMFAGDAKADVAKAANCCVKAAKDGKTLGARNGQGMQNGRSGANSAGPRGNGRGQGMNAGTGAGWGQQGTTRPTSCPLR